MTQRAIQKWEDFDHLINGISKVLETARRASARSVNAIMTAAYWEIGRRKVEFEQAGKPRADYGEELLKRLSRDLTLRYGRGFAKSNLYQMRSFYTAYQHIFRTVSGKSDGLHAASGSEKFQTLSGTGSYGKWQDLRAKECAAFWLRLGVI